MARQISVSNEVYEELSKLKGKKSFSELIKEVMGIKKGNEKLMKFAGILKKDRKNLEQLKRIIAKEREANYGREFNW
jgi:predicted CopG family antitoxin